MPRSQEDILKELIEFEIDRVTGSNHLSGSHNLPWVFEIGWAGVLPGFNSNLSSAKTPSGAILSRRTALSCRNPIQTILVMQTAQDWRRSNAVVLRNLVPVGLLFRPGRADIRQTGSQP